MTMLREQEDCGAGAWRLSQLDTHDGFPWVSPPGPSSSRHDADTNHKLSLHDSDMHVREGAIHCPSRCVYRSHQVNPADPLRGPAALETKPSPLACSEPLVAPNRDPRGHVSSGRAGHRVSLCRRCVGVSSWFPNQNRQKCGRQLLRVTKMPPKNIRARMREFPSAISPALPSANNTSRFSRVSPTPTSARSSAGPRRAGGARARLIVPSCWRSVRSRDATVEFQGRRSEHVDPNGIRDFFHSPECRGAVLRRRRASLFEFPDDPESARGRSTTNARTKPGRGVALPSAAPL